MAKFIGNPNNFSPDDWSKIKHIQENISSSEQKKHPYKTMTVNPVYGSPQLPPHTTTTQAEAAAAAYLLSLTAGAAGGIGATGASASNPTNIAFRP